MPYQLVPFLTSLGLGIWYVLNREASARSRVALGSTVLASLVIWWSYPQWLVVATLLQVGASIYVLVYLRLNA